MNNIILVEGEPGKVGIGTRDYYGCDFKIDVYNVETNEFVQTNVQMTEGMLTISSVSSALTAPATSGENFIKVGTNLVFQINDKIKVGNYIYRVTDRTSTDTINLNVPLKESLISGTAVVTSGNMGFYTCSLTLNSAGDYVAIARDVIHGLEHTHMVKVVSKSLFRMYKDLKNLSLANLGSTGG